MKALDQAIPGNKRYVFYSFKLKSAESANKIRENYPELRSRVPVGIAATTLPKSAEFDTDETDNVFGKEWIGWWESLDRTVQDILDYEKTLK